MSVEGKERGNYSPAREPEQAMHQQQQSACMASSAPGSVANQQQAGTPHAAWHACMHTVAISRQHRPPTAPAPLLQLRLVACLMHVGDERAPLGHTPLFWSLSRKLERPRVKGVCGGGRTDHGPGLVRASTALTWAEGAQRCRGHELPCKSPLASCTRPTNNEKLLRWKTRQHVPATCRACASWAGDEISAPLVSIHQLNKCGCIHMQPSSPPRYARERSSSDLPTPLGPVMKSVSPEDSEKERELRMTRDCCAPSDRVSCRTSSCANDGSAGGGDMPGAGGGVLPGVKTGVHTAVRFRFRWRAAGGGGAAASTCLRRGQRSGQAS